MSDVTGIQRLRIAIEVQGRAGSENLVLDMSAAEEICRECEDELEALVRSGADATSRGREIRKLV